MPDLDLKPHEYGPAGKRRVIPDNPYVLVSGVIAGLIILAWAYWHRLDIEPTTLFYGVALFAFATGMAFALLLKRLNLN